MDLKITSEKIANPLLVDLLKKLTDSFNRMGREFYVIGATARDIIIGQLADITSGRKTRDLDIAIAIPEWSVFDEIKEVLIADGFKKSRHMHQRFYYDDYELDIVPYGNSIASRFVPFEIQRMAGQEYPDKQGCRGYVVHPIQLFHRQS